MKTRLISLLLCMMMLFSLAACGAGESTDSATPDSAQETADTAENESAETDTAGQAEETPATVTITDDTGREVEIPSPITAVAPSGAVATMLLAALCPELMVCVSSAPGPEQMVYLPRELEGLPETGQLYGSKSTINLEALLAAEPQIIIDLGDYKPGMEEDLDALQEQIGVPVIFLQADLEHMSAAYRTLGDILACPDRGEELAVFIDRTMEMAAENSAKIEPDSALSVMYTSGTTGLDTNAEGSTQAQVLGLVGAKNAIVVDEVSNKGGGNTIDIEQLYNAAPDVIIFSPGSIYGTVADESTWQELDAVKNGTYYEIPGQPYNWMSNPPSLNMVMGVWWLGNLLYPDVYDYDMAEMTQEIYKTLWGYDMSSDEARQILANSTLKAVSVS